MYTYLMSPTSTPLTHHHINDKTETPSEHRPIPRSKAKNSRIDSSPPVFFFTVL